MFPKKHIRKKPVLLIVTVKQRAVVMCPRAIALEEESYSAPFPLSYTFNVGASIRATTLQPPSSPLSSSTLVKNTR